jgi:alkylation response protein AidB-like acyl-CoA dehydrogenase
MLEQADSHSFRSHAETWMQSNAPCGWRAQITAATPEEVVDFYREWLRALHAAGLLVPHWPVRFGGGGLGIAEQVIVQQVMSQFDAPRPRPMIIALGHAAATLMEHGSAEQQELLAGILDGEIWCQGFSEPQAGSDLASLRCRAVRAGEVYVVDGQKTWSSFAAHAAYCLLLARTDPDAPKHRGISFFVVDMSSPGISVRPIRQATGSTEFAEVFFDQVELPAASRVGAEGDGWRIARTTLTSERVVQMIELVEQARAAVRRIESELATVTAASGRSQQATERLRGEVTETAIDVEVLAAMTERVMSDLATGGTLGATGSVLKLYFSELLQRLTATASRINGLDGLRDPGSPADIGYLSGSWFTDHLRSWTWTIAAGTSEIQRNIIGEQMLGLPRS